MSSRLKSDDGRVKMSSLHTRMINNNKHAIMKHVWVHRSGDIHNGKLAQNQMKQDWNELWRNETTTRKQATTWIKHTHTRKPNQSHTVSPVALLVQQARSMMWTRSPVSTTRAQVRIRTKYNTNTNETFRSRTRAVAETKQLAEWDVQQQ